MSDNLLPATVPYWNWLHGEATNTSVCWASVGFRASNSSVSTLWEKGLKSDSEQSLHNLCLTASSSHHHLRDRWKLTISNSSHISEPDKLNLNVETHSVDRMQNWQLRSLRRSLPPKMSCTIMLILLPKRKTGKSIVRSRRSGRKLMPCRVGCKHYRWVIKSDSWNWRSLPSFLCQRYQTVRKLFKA